MPGPTGIPGKPLIAVDTTPLQFTQKKPVQP